MWKNNLCRTVIIIFYQTFFRLGQNFKNLLCNRSVDGEPMPQRSLNRLPLGGGMPKNKVSLFLSNAILIMKRKKTATWLVHDVLCLSRALVYAASLHCCRSLAFLYHVAPCHWWMSPCHLLVGLHLDFFLCLTCHSVHLTRHMCKYIHSTCGVLKW